MGDPAGCDDERPPSAVKIEQPFWMMKHEVTNELFARFNPRHDSRYEHRTSWIFSEQYLGWRLNVLHQPVVRVSWHEATAFCAWLSQQTGLKFALPTEAQWEYAARGPDGSEYPWGDWWAATLCRSAETRRRHSKTAPVGSFPKGASWCGALDMAGNVAEWCRDWYDKGFYATRQARPGNPECTDGRSGNRVMRGGSWFNYADTCRSATRAFNFPWLQDFDVGVRVVLR
jgi:formylglycine-generating enzyme required for sulfatase activity